MGSARRGGDGCDCSVRRSSDVTDAQFSVLHAGMVEARHLLQDRREPPCQRVLRGATRPLIRNKVPVIGKSRPCCRNLLLELRICLIAPDDQGGQGCLVGRPLRERRARFWLQCRAAILRGPLRLLRDDDVHCNPVCNVGFGLQPVRTQIQRADRLQCNGLVRRGELGSLSLRAGVTGVGLIPGGKLCRAGVRTATVGMMPHGRQLRGGFVRECQRRPMGICHGRTGLRKLRPAANARNNRRQRRRGAAYGRRAVGDSKHLGARWRKPSLMNIQWRSDRCCACHRPRNRSNHGGMRCRGTHDEGLRRKDGRLRR